MTGRKDSLPPNELDSLVRRKLRSELSRRKLLKRIPEDLEWIFSVETEANEEETVGDLWDPDGRLKGGKNWAGREASDDV